MSDSLESHHIVDLEVREQEIEKIIVFSDRAEIRRKINVQLKKGINEICLKNFCKSLIHDSLRVEGKGNAIIHDVIVSEQAGIDEEIDSPKIAYLRDVFKRKQFDLRSLEDSKTTVDKKLEMMEKMFGENGSLKIDSTTIGFLPELLDMYEKKAGDIREQSRGLEKKIEEARELARKAEQQLQNSIGVEILNRFLRLAQITIEASSEEEVQLDVTYQVFEANWTPIYAIRVRTEEPAMNIVYSAKIQQNTGEDWNEASLVVSTAHPTVGGKIPELGTLDAVFHVKRQDLYMARTQLRSVGAPRMACVGADVMDAAPQAEMCMAVASNVTQKMLSAEFEIVRRATIPNGTKDHKVTIGYVDLTPILAYESVPSKSTSAFLTASVTNESQFSFVRGEASLYLNNSFVGKTYLNDISPGEKFTCSLGVDAAIRISYKPAKNNHTSGGLITKHSVNVTEQIIVVKNTKETPVVITVKHHVPRSTDETIRVTLQSPNATAYVNGDEERSAGSEGARMNADSNLEWTVKIRGGETKNMLIKYTVEHPKDQKIEFREKF